MLQGRGALRAGVTWASVARSAALATPPLLPPRTAAAMVVLVVGTHQVHGMVIVERLAVVLVRRRLVVRVPKAGAKILFVRPCAPARAVLLAGTREALAARVQTGLACVGARGVPVRLALVSAFVVWQSDYDACVLSRAAIGQRGRRSRRWRKRWRHGRRRRRVWDSPATWAQKLFGPVGTSAV